MRIGDKPPPRPPQTMGLLWIFIVLAASLTPGTNSQNNGGCILVHENGAEVTEIQLNNYIDLTDMSDVLPLDDGSVVGYKYYTFKTENVINVVSDHAYLDVVYEEGTQTISIVTKDNFPSLKEDLSVSQTVRLYVEITCESNKHEPEILLEIQDNNKYDPQFYKSTYEYAVTMPLFNGYVLTNILPIQGRDFDFTTTDIQVELGNEYSNYFTAEAVKSGAQWREGFEVTLKTNSEIRWQEDVTIPVKIKDLGTSVDTNVRIVDISVVVKPDLAASVFSPRFKEPLYNSIIDSKPQDATLQLLNGPIAFEEGFSDDLIYTLTDGGSHAGASAVEFMKIVKIQNGVEIHWIDDVDPEKLEEFLEKSFAILVLTAENTNAPLLGRTVVHIALPGSNVDATTPEPCPTTMTPTECPICTTPEPYPTTEPPTECPICTTPEPCPTIETSSPEPCPTITECPTEGTTSSSERPTEYPTCPTCPTCPTEGTTYSTECPTCPTECPTEGTTSSLQCPTECPTSPTECPTEGTTSSSECPTECPTCPTECPTEGSTTCSTECPTNPSITEPEPEDELKFESSSYFKETYFNYIGELDVNIQLENGPPDVQFSLEKGSTLSPVDALEIDPSTAQVTIMYPLNVGWHNFLVLAQSDESGKGKTELWIYVQNKMICENGNSVFPLALEVLHVPEHDTSIVWPVAQNSISPKLEDNCKYEIIDGRKYFEMNEKYEVKMLDVDREAEEFGDVEFPVVRLQLKVDCDDDGAFAAIRTYGQSVYSDNSWDTAIGNIDYNPSVTSLAFIIEDINDHEPTFEISSLVVGYPSTELVSQLRTSALFLAKATDRDIGFHAKIRYSLDTKGADKFEIHPTTGAVYPRGDGSPAEDGYQFQVIAKDCDGNEGALEGKLSVTVLTLDNDHLLDLQIDGALEEDVESLLHDVGVSSGRDLRAISIALQFGSDEKTNSKRSARSLRAGRDATADAKANSKLLAVVYAVKEGKLEDAKDFEKDLEKYLNEEGWELHTSSFETECRQTIIVGGNGKNSGLLAAVIVLGVVLGLVFIAAGVAGYWFGIRPRLAENTPTTRLKETESVSSSQHSVVGIEPLTEDLLQRHDKELEATEINSGYAIPTDVELPRPTLLLNDDILNEIETADDLNSSPQPPSDIDIYDTIDNDIDDHKSAPKKSVVRFNEDVDCIEIRL